MAAHEEERLLTPAQLAVLLGVSQWWADRMAPKFIPSVRLSGRTRRYLMSDVMQVVETWRIDPGQPLAQPPKRATKKSPRARRK